jgi:hypothetical protein
VPRTTLPQPLRALKQQPPPRRRPEPAHHELRLTTPGQVGPARRDRPHAPIDQATTKRDLAADPTVPLFVVEGQKKVDALITAGAKAVVGVVGVWNWRGRNDHDGLAMLPDWEWVALKEGRQVYVVFDSDIILKQPVALAMNRLGAALKRVGAHVAYARLPSGAAGEKVGADDFLASGKALDDVVALSVGEPPEPSTVGGVSPSPEQRAQVHKAPRLASEADLLARFMKDIRHLGHVGEETACKLVFLCAVSRLLDEIVSCVLKGPSAAGKSATVDRVLAFFPDEAVLSLSGMSEKFLVYDDRPIEHKMFGVARGGGDERRVRHVSDPDAAQRGLSEARHRRVDAGGPEADDGGPGGPGWVDHHDDAGEPAR